MNSWGDIPLSPVRLFTKAEGRQFVPRPKEKLAGKPDVFVRIGCDDDVNDLDEGGAGDSAKVSHRFQPRFLRGARPPMSALGQKRKLRGVRPMSVLPPKAGIRADDQDVCFGSKADIPPGPSDYR
jgi:hypothetical protein